MLLLTGPIQLFFPPDTGRIYSNEVHLTTPRTSAPPYCNTYMHTFVYAYIYMYLCAYYLSTICKT